MINNVKHGKLNNRGTTLIEIMVVIAIAAVLMGGIGFSISLMFSRDAESAARLIDNELSEARSLAMSKAGNFEVSINTDGSGLGKDIVITQTVTGSSPVQYNKVTFSKPCLVSFAVNNDADVYGSVTMQANKSYKIVFDKANGCVKTIDGATVTGGLYKFRCVSTQGNTKESDVFLVPATGRHYINRE